MKNWKPYNPLLDMLDVYVKTASGFILFSNKILKDTRRNFDKNTLTYRVHPLSCVIMNLKLKVSTVFFLSVYI